MKSVIENLNFKYSFYSSITDAMNRLDFLIEDLSTNHKLSFNDRFKLLNESEYILNVLETYDGELF